MSRTIRRKGKQRRTRRKIRGGIKLLKTAAIALGLITAADGNAPPSDEKLTLLDGRVLNVRPGFSRDGVYMRKRDIPRPPQEDNNGLVVRPTDNSLQLSDKMKEIFQPVTITGTTLEKDYAKWVWIKNEYLCQVADSLISPFRPGENLLKCETKSKYKALDTSVDK